MASPYTASTAAQQAGKAPICSGSTTCWATTSPSAFISAQEASCDSRTMVENPVRNNEFCISCTMPDRLALTTSRSTASTGWCAGIGSVLLRHDQVLPLIDARRVARINACRAIELVEYGRAVEREPHVKPLALIDRAFDIAPVHPHA